MFKDKCKKKPQRYINKNRMRYRYPDNEDRCQQLFGHIFPAIYGANLPIFSIFFKCELFEKDMNFQGKK